MLHTNTYTAHAFTHTLTTHSSVHKHGCARAHFPPPPPQIRTRAYARAKHTHTHTRTHVHVQVLQCVQRGGKVLIPVFAVGRAQELMILVEEAWQRLGLVGKVPILFSGHMAARANGLYRAMVRVWCSGYVGLDRACMVTRTNRLCCV